MSDGLFGWGSSTRAAGVNPYARFNTFSTSPSGQEYRGSRPGFDWGDIKSFATDELLGFDDFRRANEARKQGDVGQLLRSGGAGLYELVTTLAAPFTGGASLLAKVGKSSAVNLAPIALGVGSGVYEGVTGRTPFQSPAVARAAKENRSMSAQAGRYQGIADMFGAQTAQQRQADYRAEQLKNQDRAREMQNRMVQDINRSFTPKQRVSLENLDMNQPTFSQALRGLTTAQQEELERQVAEAERRSQRQLSEIERQEQEARLATGRNIRSAAALGAGSLADLRAAAAGRGMLASPAVYDVGRDFTAGQTALQQAAARTNLDRLLGEGARARAEVGENMRQFMDQVRRERLRQKQANETEFLARLMQNQQMYFG